MPSGIKLYEIVATSTAVFVVAAKDRVEARAIAKLYAEDEIGDVMDVEVDIGGEINEGDGAARRFAAKIPYGLDEIDVDEMSVAEILAGGLLEAGVAASEEDGPVHWCHECGFERVQFDWRNDQQVCRFCIARAAEAM